MKVTIIGGGNIGVLMAAEISKKAEVSVYATKADIWKPSVDVFDNDDKFLFSSNPISFTDDLSESTKNTDIVFITYPSYLFEERAEQLFQCIEDSVYIGVVPGSGGAEFAFKKLIDKGCKLFGFQRVHSIARIKEVGKSVYMLGRKDQVFLSSIPSEYTSKIKRIIEYFLEMQCVVLPNYLNITLTPSNPILHTARLYSMFKNWNPDIVYPANLLFYESWDNQSSEILLKCDEEVQKLCRAIPLELSEVNSLKVHYGVDGIQSMTDKISNIPAFKGLESPMKKVENGYIPDFSSRYFTADFAYGLKVIKDIAELFGVQTPNINSIWKWYLDITDKYFSRPKFFSLQSISRDEFISLYK